MPIENAAVQAAPAASARQKIKLLVWDLDETVWHGTLLEDESVRLRENVPEILRALDARGILNSIASRNEHEIAMAKLREFGIHEFFIYPEINWNPKSTSIEKIGKQINIGFDTVAFIDDQSFEREEVKCALPDVLALDATELEGLVSRPEFIPRFITDESSQRRKMYLADAERNRAESDFVGPREEFLASLQMKFSIRRAREADLRRAEELTVRTHQLNTTGRTYSYDELAELSMSDDYLLLVAALEDKWGPYGTIGLVLVHRSKACWTIKLLLMSCRVIARGVGTIMVNHIIRLARESGVRLLAEFKPTDRNRMMLITYRMAGFRQLQQEEGTILFENTFQNDYRFPDYVQLEVDLDETSGVAAQFKQPA